MKKIILIFLCTSLWQAAAAQSEILDYRVKNESNTAERSEILEAVRSEFVKQGFPRFIFVVDHLKLKDGFAFFKSAVMNSDGSKYIPPPEEEYDCCHAEALLKKSNGKWVCVAAVAFATDVWWTCLWKEHKAPREIFDFSEDCDW